MHGMAEYVGNRRNDPSGLGEIYIWMMICCHSDVLGHDIPGILVDM